MIPFLIVTAIVNVALGYALAVYLGRANGPTTWREMFASASTPAIEATSFAAQFAMLQTDRSRPSDEGSLFTSAVRQPAEPLADDATRSTITEHQADEEPFAHAEVLEQELLAGIEEFRNQLAQLKGQGVAGILLDSMALDAARLICRLLWEASPTPMPASIVCLLDRVIGVGDASHNHSE